MNRTADPISRLSRTLALLLVCWCGLGQAQVPHKLNYQGYLTNPSGAAINNAALSLTFKLYTVASGGTELYSETQSVIVINGIFNALIGSVAPLTLAFDQPYFIGISAGGDTEMTPRQPLAASPYAIRSASSESLAATALIAASNLPATQLLPTVACATNQIPQWNGSAWICATVSSGSGSGTVSNVATGAGLTGGPISTTGTISIAPGGVTAAMLASNSCNSGQVLKWSGSAWACAADNVGGSGTVTSVAVGSGLSGGPITGAGTLSLTANQLLPTTACLASQIPKWDGSAWACAADATGGASGSAYVQGGNAFAAAAVIGTTDNNPVQVNVNNQPAVRYVPDATTPIIIGGYSGNTVTVGSSGAVIGGGGIASGNRPNRVTAAFGTVGGGLGNTADSQGTVGGGLSNTANGLSATVAGGNGNTASGFVSTATGGIFNTASSFGSTVGGGQGNSASGSFATIPGGSQNQATQSTSFAAGNQAQALHQGAFVWADSTAAAFASTANDQFLIRATGGVGIGTNNPGSKLTVAGTIESKSGGIKFPDGTMQTTAAAGGGGTVASVTASAPLASSGGTTPNIALTGVVPLANIPDLGSSYIKNGTSLQTSSNFNISGNGFIAGNVGIGTATPESRLQVAGSGFFTGDSGGLPASAGGGIKLTYDIGGNGQIFAYDYAPLASKNLVLQLPGGNVGIGTTSTSSKLTVSGTIESTSGGVKFPDGTTQATATFQWQVVAGTMQQAQPNTGYMLTNASQVTVTLPTAPNPGDTVRVSGVGGSGWKLAQNASQFVNAVNLGASASGLVWTPRDSNRAWLSVASSADGSKLVAGADAGQLYTSTNSGVTWTPRSFGASWVGVASSADGSKLVAAVGGVGGVGGQLYTSTDSGVTWIPRDSNRSWRGVASSADGTKLVASVGNGQLYTSTDSGVNWIARETTRGWGAVASSADGSKLVAGIGPFSLGQLYTSIPISSTTPGTAGFLLSGQSSAIELQYVGSGQFVPLSHEGAITIN